ncbi:MAG: MFS transporter, partial [Gemmatimonas sp.]|nr:MFS transporter [Gemmatimonas sp.]
MTPSPKSDATTPVTPALAPYVNDTRFFGHPRGLSTLFTTEMWERFSYYGLRPLLVLFMAAALNEGGFGLDRTQASAIVGIYAASVYLASLPGGWIADRWLGLRRAILIGAALITSGHLAIGVSGFAGARGKLFFFMGLALIVLGTGLLKPNISAIVGDLYPEGGARRDAGFSIFYMGINVGAFLGQLVTGFLGESVGWHYGFGAAGVGMLFGFLWFWMRAKDTLGPIGEDIVRDPDPAVQAKRVANVKLATYAGLGLIALVFALAALGVVSINPQVVGQYMTFVLVGLAVAFFATVLLAGNLTSDEKKRVGVIFVLFVFAAIFWGAFEQAPTSL